MLVQDIHKERKFCMYLNKNADTALLLPPLYIRYLLEHLSFIYLLLSRINICCKPREKQVSYDNYAISIKSIHNTIS